ncbi:hypothetical protein [Corynebacterium macginleyi]|uniref:hypothetical protein n=1 Tax=Corynebacterium macginleyi TaxID=38290 RepID=UPI001909570A|nr:hypothetical protein [Corynebacterium macginleyi]MBK4147494.1 hypothetical protein [Corynebacterium macginleyi]MBK4158269.1 hypothetical protein [Corynebacterium macginleyi]
MSKLSLRNILPLSACAAIINALLLVPPVGLPAAHAQEFRDCPGDNYVTQYDDFDGLRSYLDSFYRRKGRVWSVPNDEAVWRLWCGATKGEAILNGDSAIPGDITLSDGTTMRFRTGSKSGGDVIDIKSGRHTKLFKVHVQ